MAVVAEQVGAAPLVGGAQTALHSHAGGGGANVKSGIVSVVDGGTAAVTFGTAFAATPTVVACLASDLSKQDIVRVHSVTASGFTVAILKGHTGAGDTWNVAWIATDAGG